MSIRTTVTLDEDVLAGVDEDVADSRIAKQRLERPKAKHIVEHLDVQGLALTEVERGAFFGEELRQQRANLAFRAAPIALRERLEIQPVQQLSVDRRTQVEILLARRLGTRSSQDT